MGTTGRLLPEIALSVTAIDVWTVDLVGASILLTSLLGVQAEVTFYRTSARFAGNATLSRTMQAARTTT